MLKSKKLISIIVMVLVLSTSTSVFAAKFFDYWTTVSSSKPYVSSTFVPTTSNVSVNFGGFHTTGTITCYVQKYVNGSWVDYQFIATLSPGSGKTLQISVTPYDTYRLRITSTVATTVNGSVYDQT